VKAPTVSPTKAVLERLVLLEGVHPEAVRELAAQSRVLRVSRGEVLVRHGERVASLYVVAFGRVKIRLPQDGGSEMVLGLLGPGATFGKSALLLGRPSLVEAVTLEETMLVTVRAACVLALVERNLCFSRNLVRALAERNHALVAEVETSRLRSAKRLAAYLDSIAEPSAQSGLWAAPLPVSKTLLAARLGIKKETLSRLLREFAGGGLIDVAGREITIRDRTALQRLGASLHAE